MADSKCDECGHSINKAICLWKQHKGYENRIPLLKTVWSCFQYSDDVKVFECLSRCGMAFATSQAFFITFEKKHNSIPFNLQNAKHCQHDYLARARKWNTATHSNTFVVICWFCCTAPSHSFTPRCSLCPHPHPCMSTDFPVCLCQHRGEHWPLWWVCLKTAWWFTLACTHIHRRWANVMLCELKQCLSEGSVLAIQGQASQSSMRKRRRKCRADGWWTCKQKMQTNKPTAVPQIKEKTVA